MNFINLKNLKSLSYVLFVLVLGVLASCGSSSSSKDITAFSFPEGTGTITDTSATAGIIAVTVPYETVVTGLIATFTTTGSSVTVGSTAQVSGTTANDFTSAATYTVTAADGTKKTYVVTVTIAPRAAGDKVTFTGDGVSFKMAYVPGGLGFPEVTDAYWIGETVVTYELWNKVYTWALANGYTFANVGADGGDTFTPGVITHGVTEPVTTVSWRDAMVWSNALTEWYNATNGTHYTPVYYTDSGYTTPINVSDANPFDFTPGTEDNPYVKADATGFRLLTSNEWELAARYIGTVAPTITPLATEVDKTTAAGVTYYWTPGNYASGATANTDESAGLTEAVAWFNANSTQAVALLDPNALGLYDMSGNVLEWSFDLIYGSFRVLRGGSWGDNVINMQIGIVFNYIPNSTNNNYGFRISRTDL